MAGPQQASSSNDRKAVYQQAIEALLQTAAPSIANAIGIGAISHWVDRALLSRLVGELINIDELIDALLNFQFAHLDSQGHLHYRDEVRDVLLEWQRRTKPENYLAANRTALAYFENLVKEASATERQGLQREIIYHRIILEESVGLRILNEQLEEVFYFHQFGAAEMLVAQATQLRSELSEEGQMWLLYFESCLDMINQRDNYEDGFEELIRQNSYPLLQALSHWKLGQIRVRQQRWSDALTHYKTSLKYLPTSEAFAGRYKARVLIAVGDVYYDLAERSQVIVSAPLERYGMFVRVFNFLQNLPFMMIEWVVHRISFLPGLYFGINYQDWIIAYLLRSAANWYQRAERLFAVNENPLEFTEVNMALAKIEHQLGRWSRARQRYIFLDRVPEVNQSRYRTAKVRFGQGQAYLSEGQVSTAITLLNEAVETFRNVEDFAALGTAAFQLGLAYDRRQALIESITAYLLSAEAFQKSDDSLALTPALWKLELLNQRLSSPSELKIQIESLLKEIQERHLLARFPHKILQLYRNLALLFSIPVSYVLVFLIANTGADVLSFFETALRSSTQGLVLPVLAFLAFFIRLSFPILLAFWIFRLVYSIVGIIALLILGYQFNPIEEEQPHQLVIDKSGLTLYSALIKPRSTETPENHDFASNEIMEQVAWSNIMDYVSGDFKIMHRPLLLISRTYLRMSSHILILDGMIAGYTRLKSDIHKALDQQSTRFQNHDFIFLEWRWTTVALLLSLGLVVPLVAVGQIGLVGSLGGDMIPLPISSVVTFTVPTLLLMWPAITLWRLWSYQRYLWHNLKIKDLIVPPWLLLALANLISLLSIGWGLYLALHK